MAGVRPVMLAETAVAVFPVTGLGTPAATFPKAGVGPHWKVTVVEEFCAVTVPFRVAVVVPILVAALVTTIGGAAAVVKVISLPLVVPPALVPFTLKWYNVLGVRPVTGALTGVTVDPVTGDWVAVTENPYVMVGP